MKTLKITLLLMLINLFVGCGAGADKEDVCGPRIKSPYVSNFVGKYSMTENYFIIRDIYDNDTVKQDTTNQSTSFYTLEIKETKYNCFDIQFEAIDAYVFHTSPIYATIIDDSTFFFYQQFSTFDGSLRIIRGTGIINVAYATPTTIKMDYTVGTDIYGKHCYSATGIRQ